MSIPDWCGPPIIAGEWTELEGAEALTMAYEIGAALNERSDLINDVQPERLRVLPMPCYPGAILIEMQARVGEQAGLSNHLYGPWGLVTLDGTSAVIHDINEIEGALSLETEAEARAYHALFCNTVRGDDGRFQIVTQTGDATWRAAPDDAVFAAMTIGVCVRRVESGWEIESPIAYAGTMFVSRFELTSTGLIEMVDDQPIEDALPIASETWSMQFRFPPRGATA